MADAGAVSAISCAIQHITLILKAKTGKVDLAQKHPATAAVAIETLTNLVHFPPRQL